MSVVLGKQQQEIPGVKTVCWLDNHSSNKPKQVPIRHRTKRRERIRTIVAHTHLGIPSVVAPGTGPNTTLDERLAQYQATTDRHVSWDFSIDLDGSVTWQNDPLDFYTWQAGSINHTSLGFELIQQATSTRTANLYESQLDSMVKVIDWLTKQLLIQRQVLESSVVVSDADRFVGLVGHRNLTTNRGPGDPGDAVCQWLKKSGYETFNTVEQSKEKWSTRQTNFLGMSSTDADGIPLNKTIAAIKEHMYNNKLGLWVVRPGD